MGLRRIGRPLAAAIFASLLGASVALCETEGDLSPQSAQVDLQAPFKTRSPWRFVATQGPATTDYGDNPAPGALKLCLEKDGAGRCDSEIMPRQPDDPNLLWGPHYLRIVKPVYPRGRAAAPLLLVVTASLHSGDGGQAVVTQLFSYDPALDQFKRVYSYSTGTNNNQEVRFVTSGPLRGYVISAEPTQNAPYAYWIEVGDFTRDHAYRPIIKYRSATLYNDGNTLAVIDSEMPNIERRLGVWRPGAPLPLPVGGTKACPKPHLKGMALWCG